MAPLALAHALVALLAASTPATQDAEVARGVRMVEEGDYDTAILTLDGAAQRLARDPARVGDLSQAYLYLGIAYVGKGHEAAAKAKFREAVSRIHDLTLSPEAFPPKVIDIFEAAKEEVRDQEAQPVAPPAAAKTGGGNKALLVVAGVALAGGGVAVAAGGGGGDGAAGSGSTAANPPGSTSVTEGPFTGMMTLEGYCRGFEIRVNSAGVLTAQVTWVEANVELAMTVYRPPDYETELGHSNRTSQTTSALTTELPAGTYELGLCHEGNSCEFGDNAGASCAATYNLTVNHP